MAEAKFAPCLWFDKQAEEAARFYCDIFPESGIDKISLSPGEYPGGEEGDVLSVTFRLFGNQWFALNGGAHAEFSDAVSFQIYTDAQEETDRYWDALTAGGGGTMACSWCYDRFGVRWQIAPRSLMAGLSHEEPEVRKRVFAAMQQMIKIDHAAIDAAIKGE